MGLIETLPPLETVLEMEPEDLAPFVLKALGKLPEGRINRYNFTLVTNGGYRQYAGDKLSLFCQRLMEAWVWLEREQFVAPAPGSQDDWAFITRRGRKVLETQDFRAYQMGNLLPSENLAPILVRNVKPLFLRGDYETAVFVAFKEVEVMVREKGGYPNSDFGVSLMRKAFSPENGVLTDSTTEPGEKVAIMELFAGAIGNFKNPSSHRNVKFDDPSEVADSIHFANLLLKILEKIQPNVVA